MSNSIDEAELTRLEALAGKADLLPINEDELFCLCIDGLDEHRNSYIVAACNAVPALVAEVRRLREALNTFIEEDQSRVILVQQQMLDCMREKVEAWEWWDEADLLYGDTGLLFQMRLCAIDELYATLTAARGAVHADRE